MKVRKVLKVSSISPYERYGAEQYMYMAGRFLTVLTFLTFARVLPGVSLTWVIRTTKFACSRACQLEGQRDSGTVGRGT